MSGPSVFGNNDVMQGQPSALTNCRNGGRTFPSLRRILLPPKNNDVMQGQPSALTNCRNGGRTFPSLRRILLPPKNNDVMQGQPSALTNCRNGGRTFPSLRGIFSLFFPPLRQLLLSLRSQQKISTHGTLTSHSRIPCGRTICRQD